MGYLRILKWLKGFIPPAAFLAIFWVLLEPKCSRKTARWALAGFLTAEAVLQGVVYALGGSPEAVFTLLPLTFYLPAIIGAHLLSRYPFLPTAVGWLFALLCQELLLTAQKLLGSLRFGLVWEWVFWALLLLGAVGLVIAARRLVQKPFRAAAGELGRGWSSLLFLPVMLLALYSYLLADASYTVVLALLFFTALAATVATARLFSSLAVQRQAKAATIQMEALRQDYELLQKKLELGRSYRHDTRHHMLALSALLQQGNGEAALDYVTRWQGQLTQIESGSWCHSAAVNAVLSTYLAQAEGAGCAVETEVSLPGELPFEETDLCVVLANALENAVRACRAIPEGRPRRIRLELTLIDNRRLTVRLENSCDTPVEFDDSGFPVTEQREGHGQGLKSIAAVAEKYHGMFQCGWESGVFSLRVVLLNAAPEPPRHPIRRGAAVCAGLLLAVFLFNCMPTLAQALEAVPVLGQVIRVVDLRSYAWAWGGTGSSVEKPVLDGDSQAVDAVQEKQKAVIREMQKTFLDYALQKYQGYVAEDITYEVVRDDDTLFILRFDTTLNAGGSVDYHRHIVLDKQTERVVELSDLFLDDVNYLFPISREIKAQMEEQMKAGTGDYFLPGGIWDESECFQSIAEDQAFYVDENGRLVITFDEYEVAPGSMGAPEFTIPTDVLDGLLAQPSLLR